MTVLFPKTYQVIRRSAGSYVDGVWTPATESAAQPIELNIQPASVSDYNRLQAMPGGRRITAMVRAFADISAGLKVAGSGLNDSGYPGDIVIYKSKRWLVVGQSESDSLNDPDTSHMRYLLVLEVEHGADEITA